MQAALRTTARVLPGHRVEISAPELVEGDEVEVFLVLPQPFKEGPRRSVLDFLDSLPPGPRSAPNWEQVEQQFQEERDAWEC